MPTDRSAALSRLEPLLGAWTQEASIAPGATGQAVFEWTLDGAFLLERSEAPDPAPKGLMLVDPNADDDGYTQHYFDSRGVVRVYAMTFGDGTWTLERTKLDFTPLSFAQRFLGTFSADGNTIDSRWESSQDGGATWELDFELTFRRALGGYSGRHAPKRVLAERLARGLARGDDPEQLLLGGDAVGVDEVGWAAAPTRPRPW